MIGAGSGAIMGSPADVGPMRTVLLVRHGETTWNRQRRVQGWAPTRLTTHGRERAEALGRALEARYDIDAIYGSDLARSRETIACLRRSIDAPVSVDPDWRERNYGACQGLPVDQLFDRFPELSVLDAGADALDRRPAGGESLVELARRVESAWDRLRADLEDTALVVTHGGPLSVLVGRLDGRELEARFPYHQANCAITEVRLDGTDSTVVRENETPREIQ